MFRMKFCLLYSFIILLLFQPFCFAVDEQRSEAGEENAAETGQNQLILENLTYKQGSRHLVALVDTTTPLPLSVRVTDGEGKPVPEIPITFEVMAVPSGSQNTMVTNTQVVTDDQGIARTNLLLGTTAGDYYISVFSFHGEIKPVVILVKGIGRNWMSLLFMGLLGGMGMFLYGMVLGSKGLQKAAGTKLKIVLGKLTENRIAGILIGTVVAAILQSSSATTVMIVSLVSASLITLKQSLGVVIGANIGTAVTIHLIAFKITNYALLMIGIGFLFRSITRNKQAWYIGQVIMGFGFVFYGMHVMSLSVEPLKTFPQFAQAIMMLQNYPFVVLMLALIFTAIIQSSGVTIGLSIVLAREGLMGLDLAIPILIGAHIGTTSTALMSSMGANLDGKRVALFHFIFNLVGAVLVYSVRDYFGVAVDYLTRAYISDSVPRMIANANMAFILVTAFLFTFLIGPMALILTRMFSQTKSGESEFKPKYLSQSLLNTPELALDHALREVLRMASYVDNMLGSIMTLIEKKDTELIKKIKHLDDKVDILEESLRKYLAALSHRDISRDQSKKAVALLYIADDIEHMGDVIEVGMLFYISKLIEAEVQFSDEGFAELQSFHREIMAMFKLVTMAIRKEDRQLASKIFEKKAELACLERDLRKSHLDRLIKGQQASVESGTIHMDLLGEFRRICSLCSKVAYTIREDF